jgi:hypothetical protein
MLLGSRPHQVGTLPANNSEMQHEQNVAPKLPTTRFPMVHQPRQLGERKRSMGKRMRSLITLNLLSAAGEFSQASDLFIPKSDEEKHKDWGFNLWRNKNNGDILTVATDPFNRPLDSFADLDRAMDFSSSAYPEWLTETGFPNWQRHRAY